MYDVPDKGVPTRLLRGCTTYAHDIKYCNLRLGLHTQDHGNLLAHTRTYYIKYTLVILSARLGIARCSSLS